MRIQLTSKFKKILDLPNYIISGFRYRFSPLDFIDGSSGDDKLGYYMDHINEVPDDKLINGLQTASSFFNCSTAILNNKLNWNVTAKYDSSDDRYECILIYYYDLMKYDLNIDYNITDSRSQSSDNINSHLELAAIMGPFSELKRRVNDDIPNRFELRENIKCSILTRKFNSSELTHQLRTDIYKADPTHRPLDLDKVAMKYKPTENVLNDNKIAFERSMDSFRISASGLIEI